MNTISIEPALQRARSWGATPYGLVSKKSPRRSSLTEVEEKLPPTSPLKLRKNCFRRQESQDDSVHIKNYFPSQESEDVKMNNYYASQESQDEDVKINNYFSTSQDSQDLKMKKYFSRQDSRDGNFRIRNFFTRQESQDDNMKIKGKSRQLPRELVKYLDKDFFRRKTLRDLIELFCEATTIHGPGHVWHNRRNLMGPLWLIVTCTFSVALLVVAFQYVVSFCRRELQSQTTFRDADKTGLLLPSVVICNRAFFSKRKLEELNVTSDVSSYMYLILGSPFYARMELFEDQENLQILINSEIELENTLARLNRTLNELVDDISYTCEELIIGCRLGLIKVDKTRCCDIFTSVQTTSGKCYFLIAKDRIKQTTNGEDSGLTFYLQTYPGDEPDVDDSIIDLANLLKQGLQVTVTSNATHPGLLVSGHGTMIVPGALTSIETSLTRMDMRRVKGTVDVQEPDCVDQKDLDWPTNESLILRTMPNNFFRMTRECLLRLCNCSVYGLNSIENGKRCSALEILVCYAFLFDSATLLRLFDESGQLKEGLRSAINFTTNPMDYTECKVTVTKESLRMCETMTFATKSTTNTVRPDLLIKVGPKLGIENSTNLAAVTVFYPNLFYSNVEIWRLELNHLISELGGYMGLFLGSSLISYIEIGTFISLAILTAWRRRHSKKRASQGQG